MHARTWFLVSCAAISVIAGTGCDNKGTSPVAPDEFSAGSSSGSNPSTNAPPIITSVIASPPSILISETSTLSARVTDPDGDSVTCAWSLETGGELTPGGTTCTAVLRPTQVGTLRVRVQARDSRGASSAARTVEVAVGLTTRPIPPRPEPDPGPGPKPTPNPNPNPSPSPTPDPTPIPPPTTNRPPVVSISADPPSCTAPCAVKVKATASDPDGDPLTLTFGGCASGTAQGTYAESECQILSFAEVVASVTATDPSGASAQASIGIAGQGSQNHPPSVTLSTSADSCHPRPGAPCRITFTAQASDIDPGDTLTYTWSGCTKGSGTASADCLVSAPEEVHRQRDGARSCGRLGECQRAGAGRERRTQRRDGSQRHRLPSVSRRLPGRRERDRQRR